MATNYTWVSNDPLWASMDPLWIDFVTSDQPAAPSGGIGQIYYDGGKVQRRRLPVEDDAELLVIGGL